jgi:hypothetical protein
MLGITIPRHAEGIGSEDVEQADERERGCADCRRNLLVGQIGGEMGGNERDMESAHEESGVEQPETAHARCFAQRLAHALRRPVIAQAPGFARDADREHRGQADQPGKRDQRHAIADFAEQELRRRNDQELADGSARGDDAERHATFFGRDDAPDRAEHDGEGDAGHGQPDQETQGEVDAQRIGREGRADQADDIEQRARQRDAARAMLVGDRADKGLGKAEHQILDRQRQAEIGPADIERGPHLHQEQAERLAHAHRQRDDRGRADHDGEGRAGLHGRISSIRSSRANNATRSWPSRSSTWRSAASQAGRHRAIAALPAGASSTIRARWSPPSAKRTRPWSRNAPTVRLIVVRSWPVCSAKAVSEQGPERSSSRSSENCGVESPESSSAAS